MEQLQQCVSLHNAHFYAFHGFYPEEQVTGNEFVVNIETTMLLRSLSMQEELTETVNYEQLYRIAKNAMAEPRQLLETVAADILEKIRARFTDLTAIRVSITKLHPPFGGAQAHATVQLYWYRDSHTSIPLQ